MNLNDYFDIGAGREDGAAATGLTVVNRFYRVTVTGAAIAAGGETGPLVPEAGFPLVLENGGRARFNLPPGQREWTGATVRLTTAEFGVLSLGAVAAPNRLAALERPRSFFDIFRKEYEVNLLLDGDEVLRGGSPLSFGVNLESFDAAPDRPLWYDPAGMRLADGLVGTLRALNPAAVRFDIGSGRPAAVLSLFFDLCRGVGAAPYLKADGEWFGGETDAALATLVGLLERGAAAGDFDQGWIELEVGDEPGKAVAAAERLRARFPWIKIVFSGVELAQERSLRRFQDVLASCADAADAVGVPWRFPGPAGWESDASDADAAAIFGMGAGRLVRTTNRLFRDIPETLAKPMILTGWRYFRAPDERDPLRIQDRSADGFFYLSALASLAANSRFGLLLMDLPAVARQAADGRFHEAIGALVWRMASDRLGTQLGWRSVRDEPIPNARSEGIPGLVEASDVPDVIMSATRSLDRRRVHLLVQNLNPGKRLFARVHFAHLPDLRPTAARNLRGGSGLRIARLFQPRAAAPVLKDVSLPRYRPMDHVNLDIPPLGMVSMTLTDE